MDCSSFSPKETFVDLHTLHVRTGIDKRRLRYCVDHRLVPELEIELAEDEAGRPRRFADDVGFGIVCAARLLEIGLPHDVIRFFLRGLLNITLGGKGPRKRALVAILEYKWRALAELAEGKYVRITVDELDYDSKWRVAETGEIQNDYTPTVTVKVDLGKILDQIQGEGPSTPKHPSTAL
jgi:hypothetical protein